MHPHWGGHLCGNPDGKNVDSDEDDEGCVQGGFYYTRFLLHPVFIIMVCFAPVFSENAHNFLLLLTNLG